MNNLELYNKVRAVPKEAQKEIKGGRLAGKTDINPMWRIKTLTEQFGVCGFGWKTEIVREWLETGANGEVTANVEINLYIKLDGIDGEWSDAIPGIGGSALITKEKDGLRTDDDCYKKAYTDAISVACKALGIGADVYFEQDATKYDARNSAGNQPPQPQPKQAQPQKASNANVTEKSVRTMQLEQIMRGTKYTLKDASTYSLKVYGNADYDSITESEYNAMYNQLAARLRPEGGNG